MAEFAKEIRVETDRAGAPYITIDGQPFPWHTAGIVIPAPSRDQFPTITVTIPAEKVVMVNEMQPPAPRVSREDEIANGPYRCRHPGCSGLHAMPSEVCC
jgi:hypothetical protein